ncbi:MFS transporter [Allonocardiopsis opalescens]|uniref:DHA2 family multidrug resistance protein-like MFS transporter n=1 Tax=Allonocardiopsis opalescens TaxID=1144618 RepID=A0A2T0QD68_9ACTN|nr:MFS transporter [Allonocardiopsis opalescens]PRY01821.1 DHA2 family multidrug resistance protein-like MFS transporter [Allonocardiopsis opalescens]
MSFLRHDRPPRATARTWTGLAVLLLPALLISMDISVLFVAAPAITQALQPTAGQWLWAMDIYGFVMAGLLIAMGGLGDRIGRRRLLLLGAALFGAASLALAYAPTPELLIAGRALLAVAGATLAPSTLALIRNMFADERQRGAAVGAWTIAFTGGSVAGPVIGGLLLEHFWWGAVFIINIPVMVLLLAAGPLLLPESRDPAGAPFDLLGAAASLVAVLAAVFAVKHTAEHGADAVGAASAGCAIVAGALFARRQRRVAHPLIDLSLFRTPAFSAAIGANIAVTIGTVGLGALAFTYLQSVHGLSPLESALHALPTFAGTAAGATAAGALTARLPAAAPLVGGLIAAAAGLATVAAAAPHGGVWSFIGGYTVLAFGIGAAATAANATVLATAPPERAGAASGIAETSTELGGALGIALLGTAASAAYRIAMAGPAQGGPAAESIAGAAAQAADLPEPAASALLDTAAAAYTGGVATASAAGAALIAAAAVLTAAALRTARRRERAARALSR